MSSGMVITEASVSKAQEHSENWKHSQTERALSFLLEKVRAEVGKMTYYKFTGSVMGLENS